MDFIKGSCTRPHCKYLHPPPHLQNAVKARQNRVFFGTPQSPLYSPPGAFMPPGYSRPSQPVAYQMPGATGFMGGYQPQPMYLPMSVPMPSPPPAYYQEALQPLNSPVSGQPSPAQHVVVATTTLPTGIEGKWCTVPLAPLDTSTVVCISLPWSPSCLYVLIRTWLLWLQCACIVCREVFVACECKYVLDSVQSWCVYVCVFLCFQRWLTHLHQIVIFFLLQMRLEALTPLAVRKGEMWLNTHWSEGETLGEAPENITWDFRVTNDGDYPRLRRFLRILQIYCVLYFHFWTPIQFFLFPYCISLYYKHVGFCQWFLYCSVRPSTV